MSTSGRLLPLILAGFLALQPVGASESESAVAVTDAGAGDGQEAEASAGQDLSSVCEAARHGAAGSAETINMLVECVSHLQTLSDRLRTLHRSAVHASKKYATDLKSLDHIIGKFRNLQDSQQELFDGFHDKQAESLSDLTKHLSAARAEAAAPSVAAPAVASASSFVFAVMGQGYCGDAAGENHWSITSSCTAFPECMEACRKSGTCQGFAWSASPLDRNDGCTHSKLARCVHYKGEKTVAAVRKVQPEYTCYNKMAVAAAPQVLAAAAAAASPKPQKPSLASLVQKSKAKVKSGKDSKDAGRRPAA